MRQVFYYKMRRLLPIATVHCESKIIDLDLNNSNQEYLDIIIRNYEKHPNTQINRNLELLESFHFNFVSKGEVKKIIKDLEK